MNAVSKFRIGLTHALYLLCFSLALQCLGSTRANADQKPNPSTVQVGLSEWAVSLTPSAVPPGQVVFEVTNSGKVPHALEIEGRGVEKSTSRLMPGASEKLTLDLSAGTYEAYCPVGKGSHKMLGMTSQLSVRDATRRSAESHASEETVEKHEDGSVHADGDEDDEAYPEHEHGEMHSEGAGQHGTGGSEARAMRVVGGGPVIQILPGPFPFADKAMEVIRNRPPDQQADLTKKAHTGPYSNNVAKISGNMSLVATDRGASGDSVSGVAEFTAQDGARWKVVMDRVQTQDIPFNPRFGGVIMGLFYHGSSGVHTPLVPTIQSSLALWAFAHLYKNDQLVTDGAMVHVMLLSRTRRTSDWALDCWDCSDRPVEELQLQVTPAPNTSGLRRARGLPVRELGEVEREGRGTVGDMSAEAHMKLRLDEQPIDVSRGDGNVGLPPLAGEHAAYVAPDPDLSLSWFAGKTWGAFLVTMYPLLAAAPLLIFAALNRVSDHLRVAEVGVDCAVMGFSIVALQFVLTARLSWIEAPFGLDLLLVFHRTMALVATALLCVHPVLVAREEGWFLLAGCAWIGTSGSAA
jgi:hypothetical protein